MANLKDDIASERLILQLSREDVQIQLRDSQLAAERDMLTDRCAAIHLQLQELARLEDTYAAAHATEHVCCHACRF